MRRNPPQRSVPWAPAGPNATITGTVVERVEGAPYSFLKVETERGQMLVAVPMAEVPK